MFIWAIEQSKSCRNTQKLKETTKITTNMWLSLLTSENIFHHSAKASNSITFFFKIW